MTAIGKIPHFIRNDNKTTDILFIDFLSCTKVLMLLFLTAFNAFAETATERWVEQEAKTKDFHFSLKFSTSNDDSYGGFAPVTFRVISNKTDNVLQEMPIVGAYPNGPPDEERLSIVDANFDGHPDFSIYAISGGAGPNIIDFFYLYDPKSKKFKHHEKLSSLTLVNINPKNRTITSNVRNSCCDHIKKNYRYIHGRLTLVGSWHEYPNENEKEGRVVTIIGKLRKGKMRYTKTIEK